MATATIAAAERQSEGPVTTTSHGLKGEEDATDDGEEVNNDDEERLGQSTSSIEALFPDLPSPLVQQQSPHTLPEETGERDSPSDPPSSSSSPLPVDASSSTSPTNPLLPASLAHTGSSVFHTIEKAELVAARQALLACQAECARLASEKTDVLATAADLHHQLCRTLAERNQLDHFVLVLEEDVKRLTEAQTQAAIARHGAKARQQKWEQEKRELLEIISKQRDDRVRLKAELSKAVEEKKVMKHKQLARTAFALPRVVDPEFDEATYKHAVSELVEERDAARLAHADLQKKVATLEASVSSYSSTHLSLTSRLEAAESSSLATSKELDYALSLIDELVEEGSQLREEKELEARVRTMEEEKEKWEEETTGSLVRPRSTSRFLNA